MSDGSNDNLPDLRERFVDLFTDPDSIEVDEETFVCIRIATAYSDGDGDEDGDGDVETTLSGAIAVSFDKDGKPMAPSLHFRTGAVGLGLSGLLLTALGMRHASHNSEASGDPEQDASEHPTKLSPDEIHDLVGTVEALRAMLCMPSDEYSVVSSIAIAERESRRSDKAFASSGPTTLQ